MGNGFLGNLKETNDGSNYAINGASTETFLAEERWDRVMEDVEKKTTEYKSVVMIQFGHNNQSPEHGISPYQFWESLRRMAEEGLAVDGTPVCIELILAMFRCQLTPAQQRSSLRPSPAESLGMAKLYSALRNTG